MKSLFPLPRAPRLTTHCALGILLTSAASSMAQTAAAPDAAASAPTAKPAPAAQTANNLETITVTATRRAERLRDVPVAISKINTDQQLALGAKDLTDVLQAIPGVTVSYGGGRSTQANVTIRGVTNGSEPNPGTATYVDDVPVGGSTGFTITGFDQRLLDMQSIEVLKGPQGTLYGASSMGGVLRYNSRTPDLRLFSGLIAGEASKTNEGGNNYTAQGYVNVPLSQGVAGLRAAVFHSRDGGYIDATGKAAGKDVNRGDVTGGRLSLAARPFNGLDVRLAYQQQLQSYKGESYSSFDLSGKPIEGALIRSNINLRDGSIASNSLASLNVEFDTGWGKLYSITGYQHSVTHNTDDTGEGYIRAYPSLKILSLDSADSSFRFNRTTQELRFVSPSGGTIEWIAGAFFSRESGTSSVGLIGTVAADSPFAPNPVVFLDPATSGYFPTYRETAVYGTAVWNVLPTLALTAGIRATRNKFEIDQAFYGTFGTNSVISGTTTESPKTYLLAASYKLTPTASLYARAASGYRPGGTNSPTADPQTGAVVQLPPYTSDKLWDYEVGYKGDLPGQLGNVEVALFQINWSDIQVVITDKGTSYEGNAGKARIRGIELSSVLKPFEGLTVRPSASFQNPKLIDASPGLGGAAGERLPTSAKVQANLNVRYDMEFSGVPSYVAANVNYIGSRTVTFNANSGSSPYVLPSYKTFDVNGGATFAGVDFGVYVRNLFDERGQLSGYSRYGPVGGPVNVQVIRPRTIGLTASKSF